jgi:uncharacterized protein (DUF4415 family)
MRQVAGRRARKPGRLIAICVDASVLSECRRDARRRDLGYQMLINDVLAGHVKKGVA